jgi:hypothetical protein
MEAARATRAASRLQRGFRRRMESMACRQQCCGILLKSVNGLNLPFGLDVLLWRERFVFATGSALCCQRLLSPKTSGAVDQASTQLLRFADITHVGRARNNERVLVVRLRRRQMEVVAHENYRHTESTVAHHFYFADADTLRTWLRALRRLVELSGNMLSARVWQVLQSAAHRKHHRSTFCRPPPRSPPCALMLCAGDCAARGHL